MPITVALQTYHFKDEAGAEISDATFTVRTHLSHNARNRYMKAIAAQVPNIAEAVDVETGAIRKDFKPQIDMGILETLDRILLEDGLVGLTGVLDTSQKEIKTWEELLSFDSFYVSQVTKILQRSALAQVKNATPNPNV